MKKKLLFIALSLMLCFGLIGCGGGGDSSDAEQDNEVIYGVGDTWEVDGQWKLTIDSVTVTDQRNEFADTDPAEVIIVNYTYENLGYEDSTGMMNGLYIDLDMSQVIDSTGQMCQTYPSIEAVNYAQETPIGATCTAQACFGLSTAGGPVKIIITEYDGNDNEQTATFELTY